MAYLPGGSGVDPILLQQALDRAKAMSVAGANRTVVGQDAKAPTTYDTGKSAPLQDPYMALGDPNAGIMPPLNHPPIATQPMLGSQPPTLDEGETPPPQHPFQSRDQNIINPDEGMPQAPKQMEARNDVNIEPAGSKYDAYDDSPQGPIAETPVASAIFKGTEGAESKAFFDNPAGTDALLAFGAAMLQAPDFNSGLGAAADAVRKVAQPYRPMTEAEKSKLDYTAQHELRLAAAKQRLESNKDSYQGAGDFYDENNKLWQRIYKNGIPQWTDEHGNIGHPQGAVRAVDSMVGSNSRAFTKDNMEAGKAVDTGQQRLADIDRAISLYDESGAGAGWYDGMKQMVAGATGMDMAGIKVSSMQEFAQLVERSGLLEAQGQRGLGQLTEGERAMIRAALPGMGTNKVAFMNVMNTMKKSIERRERIYSEWQQEGALGSFRQYYLREMRHESELQKAASQNGDGGMKPGDSMDIDGVPVKRLK